MFYYIGQFVIKTTLIVPPKGSYLAVINAIAHILSWAFHTEVSIIVVGFRIVTKALQYFFENTDNFFELVRRRKPRFEVPDHWSQVAKVQALGNPAEIKSPLTIIDLSRTGMRDWLSTCLIIKC